MAEILGIFHNMLFHSMYQIQQLNSPLGIHIENLKKKKKKTGKITYIKMERFLKFKIVTGYSLGIY